MMDLAKRVIKQTVNDKRSIMMILVAPLLILTLVYFLLGDSNYKPTVGIEKGSLPEPLVTAMEEQHMHIKKLPSEAFDEPESYLKKHEAVDALFELNDSSVSITLVESSTKGAKAMTAIQDALANVNPAAKMDISYVYGDADQTLFDSLGYVFLALFSFFLIFIISGMALVRERSGGTLERLLMTPIKRSEVILGYTLGYSVFAVVQAILIVLYAVYVLDLSSAGHIGWIFVTMVLLAIVAVSFGAMISVFARSELQVVQLIPFTIIPQVFFSGLIPLDLIPYHLGNLCYIMPIYYGAAAIKGIMVYGDGFAGIWMYLAGLLGFVLILFLINMQAMKKFRRL